MFFSTCARKFSNLRAQVYFRPARAGFFFNLRAGFFFFTFLLFNYNLKNIYIIYFLFFIFFTKPTISRAMSCCKFSRLKESARLDGNNTNTAQTTEFTHKLTIKRLTANSQCIIAGVIHHWHAVEMKV